MLKIILPYGLSITGTFIIFLYSLYLQLSNPDWMDFLERLGLPVFLLIGLLWLLSKAGKSVWEYLKPKIDELTSVPFRQLERVEKDRQRDQERFESIVREVTNTSNAAIAALSKNIQELTEELRKDRKQGR